MNVATPVEPATQLVTIPKGTALSVFTTEKAMDPFLARIRSELDAFTPDISTATGRKAVASMAYKVAQTKTYLEGVGKALADEQKEIPKKIDACRKNVRDTLDKWRDEVRKPLTDWEAAEEARVTKHTDTITALNEISRNASGMDSARILEGLDLVNDVTIGPACEEFEADYARAKEAARSSLMEELPKAEKREAEAAELIRLRAESDARAQADREEAIRKEAAAEATRIAEAEAQKRLDDEAAKTDAARKDAEAATQRAEETEARLKKEAADKAAAEEADRLRRESDKEHKKAINRAALTAFVKGGLSPEAATQAIILIATHSIPSVTILY